MAKSKQSKHTRRTRSQKVATSAETLKLAQHLLGKVQQVTRGITARGEPKIKRPKQIVAALNEAMLLLDEEKRKGKGVFFAPQSRMAAKAEVI